MQLRLTIHQGVHFVWVFEHFGVAKAFVDFLEFLEQVDRLADALLDDLLDRPPGLQMRVLLEVAHRVAGREDNFALIVFVESGDDLEQGGFAGAIESDDANLGAIEEGEVDVFQHLFLGREGFAHAHHREDDFLVVSHK